MIHIKYGILKFVHAIFNINKAIRHAAYRVIFNPFTSGNSKRPVNYLPAARSLKEKLKKEKLSYKEQVIGAKTDNIQFKLRNADQVKYFQGVGVNQGLGRDPLVTVHELAYMLPGYVRSISTYPDVVVCFGMLVIMNVLQRCPECLLISYDTTFNLGDFYLSVLVVKLNLFNEQPCMPVAFMLHDRKFQAVHETFFEQLKQRLSLLTNVVIVTDGESGLGNAIEKIMSDWRVATCSVHIQTDVEVWLKRNGANQPEIFVYKSHLQELLKCENEGELKTKLETLKSTWSLAFASYYESHLSKRVLRSYVGHLRSLGLKCTSITTNMSESLNAVIKRFQDWTEAPLDAMVLALYRLQLFYLAEIQKSTRGFGPYTLGPRAPDAGLCQMTECIK